MALACVAPLFGCQRFSANKSIPESPVTLAIQLDKTSYRPGEPVRISAVLSNAGAKTIKARELDADSVAFFYCREGDPEPMERRAVISRQEQMGAAAELPANGTLKNEFLMTRLTYYSGPMTVVAIYDPKPAGGKPAAKINSNVAKFQVAGEQMFAREPNSGLITSDEARRLAMEKARLSGRDGAQAVEIIPVQDEKGYDKWWVNIKSPNPSGIDELTGWMVNPYTGNVLQTRVPFDSKLAINKRLIRKSAPKSAPKSGPARPSAPGK